MVGAGGRSMIRRDAIARLERLQMRTIVERTPRTARDPCESALPFSKQNGSGTSRCARRRGQLLMDRRATRHFAVRPQADPTAHGSLRPTPMPPARLAHSLTTGRARGARGSSRIRPPLPARFIVGPPARPPPLHAHRARHYLALKAGQGSATNHRATCR